MNECNKVKQKIIKNQKLLVQQKDLTYNQTQTNIRPTPHKKYIILIKHINSITSNLSPTYPTQCNPSLAYFTTFLPVTFNTSNNLPFTSHQSGQSTTSCLVRCYLLATCSVIFSNHHYSTAQSSRMKITFISGLVFCSALIKNLYHQHLINFHPFDPLSYTENSSPIKLIFSGLLIGFGSQYAKIGNNHSFSLDAFPQFTLKSILASIIVFISATLTHLYHLHHYLPSTPFIIQIINLPQNITYTAYLLVFMLIPFLSYILSSKKSFKMLICYLSLFTVGVFYAYCLMFGKFTEIKQVYTYFGFPQKQSAILLFLYGYGIVVSGIMYIIMRFIIKKPLFGGNVVRDEGRYRYGMILGSIMYGMGWGLGGLSVGSGMVLIPLQSFKIVFYWGLSCLIGMKFSHKVFEQSQREDVVVQEKKTE